MHVEHHPARREHGGEWQDDGEQRQGGQLQAHRREQPEAKGGADADDERHGGEDERDLGHGVNL